MFDLDFSIKNFYFIFSMILLIATIIFSFLVFLVYMASSKENLLFVKSLSSTLIPILKDSYRLFRGEVEITEFRRTREGRVRLRAEKNLQRIWVFDEAEDIKSSLEQFGGRTILKKKITEKKLEKE